MKESITGLALSRDFYEAHGKQMLREHFPQYEDKIAVGLVGQGSECFGFDDIHSQDHDFGAGFCMWLPQDLFDSIGEDLQTAYNQLPSSFQGYTRFSVAPMQRIGVFSIPEFYESLLSFPETPKDFFQWMCVDDFQLAEATNGAVFRDDLGSFSKIREELLAHYPPDVIGKKLAEKVHIVSQQGQYNFQRMLKRGDTLSAQIILSEFLLHTMELICLLNKSYAPYYKWTYAKAKTLPILSEVYLYFDKINHLSIEDEGISSHIETVISMILLELQKQGFIKTIHTGNFLHDYIGEVASFGTEKK